MALYPFILVKDENCACNTNLINHERIHLRQQIEMLILPFYLVYALEYLYRRLQKKNHYAAYRHISFEREAYANENNENYLQSRRFWNFLKWT
ncbi:MAG: hypothetical protein H6579_05585 [Chitinophagales bacterium]|nr:hypothetical protein [Chitinophagales bacterium]